MRYFKLFSLAVFGSILLGLTSCQKEPTASFTASKTAVVTDETITFTNTSKDGDNYKWEFGDGVTSTLANPTHSYENEGTYNVQMTAYSKNGKKSNKATATITVTKANAIKYDGNNYPLTKGYLENYGYNSNTDSYNFDITLVDNGITMVQGDLAGTGNIIYVELYSYSNFVSGTYTFSNSGSAQTFDTGWVGINYDITNDIGINYACTEGTVTVSQSGTNYIIDITFTLESGQQASVHYEGSLIYYDYTSKKMKSFFNNNRISLK